MTPILQAGRATKCSEMPRSLTEKRLVISRRTRTEPPQIKTTQTARRSKNEDGGLHVGIMGWLLVWLIVNALFVVWRTLVTTEVETRDRLLRKMPNVADL